MLFNLCFVILNIYIMKIGIHVGYPYKVSPIAILFSEYCYLLLSRVRAYIPAMSIESMDHIYERHFFTWHFLTLTIYFEMIYQCI